MSNPAKFLDEFQYRHRPIGFIVAVIKRYSEDNGGRSAALLAYYVFLSLFPLLFWLSLLSRILNSHFPGATSSLIHGATSYFPVLGQQLTRVSHSARVATAGIVVSSLVTLYGARGTAMVFRGIVNDIFAVPKKERIGFPYSWLKGLGIVLFGGGGFIITAIVSGWVLAQGHAFWFKALVAIIDIVLLTIVFSVILKLSLPKHYEIKSSLAGALAMALALSVLQLVGGFIVTHELKHYTNTYSVLFSTTLGLIAWIYLESQILLYSIEITLVASKHLWPRRLIAD